MPRGSFLKTNHRSSCVSGRAHSPPKMTAINWGTALSWGGDSGGIFRGRTTDRGGGPGWATSVRSPTSSKIVGGGVEAGGISGGLTRSGRVDTGVGSVEGSVGPTLKVILHPRQRMLLLANAGFMRNVRPHCGQLRASWPSITHGLASGGSDLSVACADPRSLSGTLEVSCGI
jgi:hypothetical protein